MIAKFIDERIGQFWAGFITGFLVGAAVFLLATGCTPTEPTEHLGLPHGRPSESIDTLSSETQKTDGGVENPERAAITTVLRDSGRGWPAVHLEPNTGTHIPMRVIPLASEVPPHACQNTIFGGCLTCMKYKQRRAMQDTTNTYNPGWATLNPWPLPWNKGRQW